MTDIAQRLGWDEPPLNERGNQEPRAAAIPQGEDFLSNPPSEFTVPKWNLRYRKLESTSSYISYICDNGQLVDQVFFLRNLSILTQVQAYLSIFSPNTPLLVNFL